MPATEVLTLAGMIAIVDQSRAYIVNQELVLARLTEQGHTVMAGVAKSILATMHQHLATEIEMVAVMQKGRGEARTIIVV